MIAVFTRRCGKEKIQTAELPVARQLKHMYITIYFNEKPLYLCDSIDEKIQPYVHHDDAIFIDELDPHTIKTMIHEMELPQIHAGVFFHTNLEELKKGFFKKFTLIKAAGGLVINENKDYLLIFRRGKWDLPKGKFDKGEKPENCAIREVQEETGLQEVTLSAFLATTYHTYHEGSKHILKESTWYSMQANSTETLHPQTEEQITEIKWVKDSELPTYLKKSFPLVKEVIAAYRSK
jgi:8-oxo-dGTP pyrophosphatase MutT (NUDIX family)